MTVAQLRRIGRRANRRATLRAWTHADAMDYLALGMVYGATLASAGALVWRMTH